MRRAEVSVGHLRNLVEEVAVRLQQPFFCERFKYPLLLLFVTRTVLFVQQLEIKILDYNQPILLRQHMHCKCIYVHTLEILKQQV